MDYAENRIKMIRFMDGIVVKSWGISNRELSSNKRKTERKALFYRAFRSLYMPREIRMRLKIRYSSIISIIVISLVLPKNI